jgi:hypothetical protein
MAEFLSSDEVKSLVVLFCTAGITLAMDLARKWLSKRIDIWEDETRREKHLEDEHDSHDDSY